MDDEIQIIKIVMASQKDKKDETNSKSEDDGNNENTEDNTLMKDNAGTSSDGDNKETPIDHSG